MLRYLGLAMGAVGGLGLAFDWGTDDQPAVAAPAGPLPSAELRLVAVQPLETYEYTSDGQITMVAGTRTFVVDGTVAGQTGPREYHFAIAGGRYRILLDCGELWTGG